MNTVRKNSHRRKPWLLTLSLVLLGAPWPQAQAEVPWYMGSSEPAQNAPSAIDTIGIAPGNASIVVAVIDSGVVASHPTLSGVLLPGYDMISTALNLRGGRSNNYAPDERDAACNGKLVSGTYRTHGTEVSSVIAGNGVDGMVGINPKAKIVPIRVFGSCGMSIPDMIDSLSWAAGLSVAGVPDNANPARVINVSISGGGPVCSPPLQQAIDKILAKNVFIVAAAGNNFQKPLAEPANCKGVISVGAVNAENQIEKYSALDPRTTIYSPGGGQRIASDSFWAINKIRVGTLAVDSSGNEKASVQDKGVGTSFAAPIVAGFVALWLSLNPNKTPADWLAEKSQFVRKVSPLEKCQNCVPEGLVANAKLKR
jgi:serine protease